MSNKAVVSLCTGLEDVEKVTIAFLVAVGAAETGRPTLMFLTKEAVRLATTTVNTDTEDGPRPAISALMARYRAAGGIYFVCPICVTQKKIDEATLIDGAKVAGTIPMWEWIGDGATAFSY